MQILVHLCFLLIFCSVLEFHKRVLEYLLGFGLMDSIACFSSFLKHLSGKCDFGYGFFMLWSFKLVFEALGLFLLLGFGLKVLKIRFLCDSGGKSGILRDGIRAKDDFDGKCISKISSCNCRLLKYLHKLSPPEIDKSGKTELLACEADGQNKANDLCSGEYNYDDNDDDEKQHYDEDKEFDVLTLRKLIKIERRRANSALLELEKERMSAATAVEESMAMILRLQNEKSLIEMESNQYRRLTEEKLLYDQEVIQSLHWLVMRHESDRILLEEQLKLYHQKLRRSMESDDEMDRFHEVEESFSSSEADFEDVLDHSLFSSHVLDLSPHSFWDAEAILSAEWT